MKFKQQYSDFLGTSDGQTARRKLSGTPATFELHIDIQFGLRKSHIVFNTSKKS